jgi:outer membrane lipoprotein SlyB
MSGESSIAYVVLAGLYLVGVIGGLVLGSAIGEAIGKKLERPIPGIFIGAAAGGTIGCALMYLLTRWGLRLILGLPLE